MCPYLQLKFNWELYQMVQILWQEKMPTKRLNYPLSSELSCLKVLLPDILFNIYICIPVRKVIEGNCTAEQPATVLTTRFQFPSPLGHTSTFW
jgi:hypothetical protein